MEFDTYVLFLIMSYSWYFSYDLRVYLIICCILVGRYVCRLCLLKIYIYIYIRF